MTQPLAFGNYSNGSTQPLDSALVTVDVVCDAQTGGTVYLDGGQHLDGTTRRMSNGAGQYLSYEVYRGEAGGVSPYGLVIGSGGYVVGVGAGTVNINGRIFSGQRVVPGNYSDTLLVTLYW